MEKKIWQRERGDLFEHLQCGEAGLSSQEAAKRLEQYGANELQAGGRKSTLRIFLEQFKDVLVVILLAAAGISAVLSDWESALVILSVILLNLYLLK